MNNIVVKIKRWLLAAIAFAIMSASVVSCASRDIAAWDPDPYFIDYGIVWEVYDGDSGKMDILRDDGVLLKTDTNNTDWVASKGDRVMISYSIVGDRGENIIPQDGRSFTQKVYGINLRAFYDIESSSVIYPLTPDEDKVLGKDGISVASVRSAGRYLNFRLEYLSALRKEVKHDIKLVYIYYDATNKVHIFELRHNAYGEIPGSEYLLRSINKYASFRIPDSVYDRLDKSTSEETIQVNYKWYAVNSAELYDLESTTPYKPFPFKYQIR